MAENKYKIKITPKANDDLDEIYSYIVDETEKQVVVMRVLYGRQKYQDII